MPISFRTSLGLQYDLKYQIKNLDNVDFSEAQIHAFAKFLRDNHVRPKVVKHCTSAWKPKVLEFIDFVDRSSKGTIYWKFV